MCAVREALEASWWLKTAGFPQYVQLFEGEWRAGESLFRYASQCERSGVLCNVHSFSSAACVIACETPHT